MEFLRTWWYGYSAMVCIFGSYNIDFKCHAIIILNIYHKQKEYIKWVPEWYFTPAEFVLLIYLEKLPSCSRWNALEINYSLTKLKAFTFTWTAYSFRPPSLSSSLPLYLPTSLHQYLFFFSFTRKKYSGWQKRMEIFRKIKDDGSCGDSVVTWRSQEREDWSSSGDLFESEATGNRNVAYSKNHLRCGPGIWWQCGWMQRKNTIEEKRRTHSQFTLFSICNLPHDLEQIEFWNVYFLISKLQITYTMKIMIDQELQACCLVHEKGSANYLHHYKNNP